jgi:hypothetical protein
VLSQAEMAELEERVLALASMGLPVALGGLGALARRMFPHHLSDAWLMGRADAAGDFHFGRRWAEGTLRRSTALASVYAVGRADKYYLKASPAKVRRFYALFNQLTDPSYQPQPGGLPRVPWEWWRFADETGLGGAMGRTGKVVGPRGRGRVYDRAGVSKHGRLTTMLESVSTTGGKLDEAYFIVPGGLQPETCRRYEIYAHDEGGLHVESTDSGWVDQQLIEQWLRWWRQRCGVPADQWVGLVTDTDRRHVSADLAQCAWDLNILWLGLPSYSGFKTDPCDQSGVFGAFKLAFKRHVHAFERQAGGTLAAESVGEQALGQKQKVRLALRARREALTTQSVTGAVRRAGFGRDVAERVQRQDEIVVEFEAMRQAVHGDAVADQDRQLTGAERRRLELRRLAETPLVLSPAEVARRNGAARQLQQSSRIAAATANVGVRASASSSPGDGSGSERGRATGASTRGKRPVSGRKGAARSPRKQARKSGNVTGGE